MSFIKLNDFTNSIEGLPTLNESVELTEKFSDSMPDWLAKRLLTTKLDYNYSHKGQERDFSDSEYHAHADINKTWDEREASYKKKNPSFGPNPTTYANVRGEESSKKQSLWNKFKQAGISLDTAEFTEGPVPERPGDPRLKDDDLIPIFLLDNNQVYAMGLNDAEEFRYEDDKGNTNYKAFSHVPTKYLLPRTVAFATVSKDEMGNREKINQDRKEARNELPKNYDRDMKTLDVRGPGREVYSDVHRGWTKLDKSGYAIIPMKDKYKEKLKEMRVGKIPQILDRVYRELNGVKSDIAQVFMSNDIKGDSELSDTFIRGVVNGFNSVKSDYNDLVNDIERITADTTTSEDEKAKALTSYTDSVIELENKLNDYLDDTNEYLGMDLDWI